MFTKKEGVEEANEINALTTIGHKLFNLIEGREIRQKQEAEQKKVEQNKNNLWEAIKEVSSLEEHICYNAVKLIHQLVTKDLFISISVDNKR